MGTVIAIAQTKGGSGKTTLAAHLAIALRSRLSVALLDIDPQGSLGEWYERREARLGEDATTLGFRTASGWGARREARSLARDFDVVIVDTPPKSDHEARHAIDAADLVAVPVQPTPVDLWATRATVDMIGSSGPARLLVLNRVPPRASSTAEMAAAIDALGCPVAFARLGNRVGYASAMGIGSTALETGRDRKAADEVTALGLEITKLMRR